jgi:hypothetical protein
MTSKVKKNIGKLLIGMAGIGTLGNLSSQPVQGVLGGLLLGSLGHYLIKSAQKGNGLLLAGQGLLLAGQGHSFLDKKMLELFRKKNKLLHTKQGAGFIFGKSKNPDMEDLKFLLKTHKDKLIHISDILGPDYKKTADKFLKLIMHGGSKHKVMKDVINFFKGKKKFKPSDLVSYTGSLIGLAGMSSALVPGINIVSLPTAGALSMGLRAGSNILKTSGYGLNQTNFVGGYQLDEGLIDNIKRLADDDNLNLTKSKLGILLMVSGTLLASAFKLYKKFKKQQGNGIFSHTEMKYFENNYPTLSNKIKTIKNGNFPYSHGAGLISQSASGKNNNDAQKYYNTLLLSKTPIKKYKRKKGLIVGSKQEVWDENLPHKITSGGLMRKDLMVNKHDRVVSIKKFNQGKKLYQSLKK